MTPRRSMRYAALLWLLMLLLALPNTTLAQSSRLPGLIDPEFFGMVIRDPYYDFDSFPGMRGSNTVAQDEMGRRLEQLGVRWVRLEFIADSDGRVNFDRYDYFLGVVAPRHNLKVLGLLATRIVTDYAAELNLQPTGFDSKYGGGVNDYMHKWLDESLRIADRYDDDSNNDGVPDRAPLVHAYELFNEANRLLGDGTSLATGLSYAGLDPVRLARAHAKFYRICKNTDRSQPRTFCSPETKIILGGLHPKGTSNRRNQNERETFRFTDRQYLQEIYRSAFKEFKDNQQNVAPWLGAWPVDGIGYHPYPEEIDITTVQSIDQDIIKIFERLILMRRALIDEGDSNTPFWITEIGFNTGFYKVRGPDAAGAQEQFLRQIYTGLWLRPDVANVFWFKYEDFPPAEVVLDPSGNPVVDPQRWGLVRIPFSENERVNGVLCAGGACYEPSGRPAEVRPAFFAYRELAQLAVQKVFLPFNTR